MIKSSKLFKGALFVTIATLLVKILSIIYKIPYQNLTGDKGFYIYQQLYPIYSLFVSLATFGLPLAISEGLVRIKDTKKVLSSIFTFILILGIIFIFVIIVFNHSLANIFNDPNLSELFSPLIIVLFLIPIVSVIRGYLYSEPGLINKVGTSQIIEQVFRVLVILLVLLSFKNQHINNLYDVAKYSLLGFGVGMFFSVFFLLFNMDYRLIQFKDLDYNVAQSIFNRGLFLMMSSSVLLLLQLVDSLTIVKTLSHHMNINQSMVIKGVYDRGLPIIQTALFFVSPLLSSLLPHIKTKEAYGNLLTLIILLALPASLGMTVVMSDLNLLLFGDQQLTKVLQINSLVIFLYAIFLTLSAVITNSKKIIFIIVIGMIIKFIMNIILINEYLILGAAISSIISLTSIIIIILISTKVELILNWRLLFKIIIASFTMLFSIMMLNRFQFLNHLVYKVLIGILIYGGILFLLNVGKKDLMIK